MGMEHRKHPRVDIKLHVEYRGKSVWQNVDIKNLSSGGVFIVTEKVEPRGTPVEVYFSPDGKTDLYIEAQVAWCREKSQVKEETVFPAGMGIQFKKIYPSQGKKVLEEIIESKRKK